MRRCAGRWGIRALSQQNCFMSPMLGEGFKMCFRFHSFALVCHSSDIFIIWTNYFDIHCICQSANANILAFGEVNGKENAKEMAKAEKKAKKRVKQRNCILGSFFYCQICDFFGSQFSWPSFKQKQRKLPRKRRRFARPMYRRKLQYYEIIE